MAIWMIVRSAVVGVADVLPVGNFLKIVVVSLYNGLVCPSWVLTADHCGCVRRRHNDGRDKNNRSAQRQCFSSHSQHEMFLHHG